MTHFNESSEYWGDRVEKMVGVGGGRLTARSVKIFADGTCDFAQHCLFLRTQCASRCFAIRWGCGKYLLSFAKAILAYHEA